MGVGKEAVANGDIVVEDSVGEEDGVVANMAVFADDDVSADVHPRPDARGGSDDGGPVNARFVARRGVEEFDGAGPGEIGVWRA
jgi:hypothetical protein